MIRYKIDVFKELSRNGFNQTRIQRENLLPRQTITNIKAGKSITLETLNKICLMCRLQPGDIIEVVPTDEEKSKYHQIIRLSARIPMQYPKFCLLLLCWVHHPLSVLRFRAGGRYTGGFYHKNIKTRCLHNGIHRIMSVFYMFYISSGRSSIISCI